MVLCLVTLTDLQTRRAGLSASAELLVSYCDGVQVAYVLYLRRQWNLRCWLSDWTLTTAAMYTSEELFALNGYDARPARPVRKAILAFAYGRRPVSGFIQNGDSVCIATSCRVRGSIHCRLRECSLGG